MIENNKINEASEEHLLSAYLNSRGINPKFVTKDTKISHAKSAEFAKWKVDHQNDRRFSEENNVFGESKKLTSLEKFRKASSEREKKHAEIEKNQSKDGSGMTAAIDRLQKHLNKESTNGGISKTKETSFHKKLDKLVHNTFGKRKDELKMKEEAEQIDELKMSTVKSYHKKRLTDFSYTNKKPGETSTKPRNARIKKVSAGIDRSIDRQTGHKPTSEETVSEVFSTGVQGHVSQAALDSIKNKRNVKVNLGTPSYNPKPKTLAKKPSKKASFISKLLNREDTHQDSYAATQTTGMEIADLPADEKYNRKKEMSKSARMIKSLYKKHGVKEGVDGQSGGGIMYDKEKTDKLETPYGKKPSMVKADKKLTMGDNEPQAAAVLTGGKTLTGQTRDTLEIDPLMRKPGPPIDQNKKT